MIAQWGLLEFSFHAALGVDLEEVWRRKSWRWFVTRIQGLLTTDTPIARHFAPEPDKPEAPDDR